MCLREFKLLDGTCLQAKNCETYTHGENNTAHAYRCKIGINLYRPLEFVQSSYIYRTSLKVLCDLNYEDWFKSNVTDVIVFVARKKKIQENFIAFIHWHVYYIHDVLVIIPLQKDNFSQKIDLSPATSKVRHMKLSPYI